MKDDAVLCYVDSNHVAYFTTQSLEKQWGDDWNDAPYEHNAGTPYTWHCKRSTYHYPCSVEKRDCNCENPTYEVYELWFDAPLRTPDYGHLNSPWSVEAINSGAVPWLKNGIAKIYAGTTLRTFRQIIAEIGGRTEDTAKLVT